MIGADGSQVGIVDTSDALRRADEAELDLVEVAPKAQPPVCRIMDYGKYKYELSKKEKSNRKKQVVINVKEIRFRPKIEEHDFDFKAKNARKFIESGDKVKAIVFFRGREMAHREFGAAILERLVEELSEVAKVERAAQMEGRSLVMYLVKNK